MNHILQAVLPMQRRLNIAILSGFLLFPWVAGADAVEGKMNGIHCATEGETCPVDRLDPHIALEQDFVVQQANGDYYFILNVDRAVKARYVLDDVRVTGDVNARYRAINAESLEVKKEGAFKVVWSEALQRREYEERRLPGATRP